jgi:hypothetical protein
MTQPTEQLLREVFAEQTAPISSMTDFVAGAGGYNRRRHRQQVVATAAAAAVVLTGVPLTLASVRGTPSAPTAAAPTSATAPAEPSAAPEPTRGSLAGDKALIDQAVRLLLTTPGLSRSSVQVAYAEQYEGYRIVVLSGIRASTGEVVRMIASAQPGRALSASGAGSGTPQAIDAQLAQRFRAPQFLLTRFVLGNRNFGVALFPTGYRATIRRDPTIAADCRLDAAPATALPLPSFFPIDSDDDPTIAVYAPGETEPGFVRSISQQFGDSVRPQPPANQIAAQVRAGLRGKKDVAADLVTRTGMSAFDHTGSGQLPDRWFGVWAGDLPAGGGYAALWGGHYPSGALVLQGVVTQGNGLRSWLEGCATADALDHTVFATRLNTAPGRPVLVIAPPTAVTAEVSVGSGAPVTVPLSQGAGFLRNPAAAGQVRALDAAGKVVGTGRIVPTNPDAEPDLSRGPLAGLPLSLR